MKEILFSEKWPKDHNRPAGGKMKKNPLIMILFTLSANSVLFSQEALTSTNEMYFDFLSLNGHAQRPHLAYRTLSDNKWNLDGDYEHPWKNKSLANEFFFLDKKISLRIYDLDLFSSINTAAPFGYNDGALWQGKGFNSSLSTGVRLEFYGFELTYKPLLAFSQNLDFKRMDSNYDSEYGYFWGYRHNIGIDLPQRFGDKPFFTYDWGDSEIRYTWKTLTAGFGTQSVWLGPAYINPILHSNNAPTYPKFDLGIRRTSVTIPYFNTYIGDFEARVSVGYLSESEYFDNDEENDHNMFHLFSFSYSPPSFLEGLTVSANRVCLVPWDLENLKYIWPNNDNTIEDQKISFGLSWKFDKVGFEIFAEMGLDDNNLGINDFNLFRNFQYPFHTFVYTAGLKKTFTISHSKKLYGELIFEWSNMEMSQDYQYMQPYSFNFHFQRGQGYTNRGQLINNNIGAGGNSQYLEYKFIYPRGTSSVIFGRNNPDNNFIFAIPTYEANSLELLEKLDWGYKAHVYFGANSKYFFNNNLTAGLGLFYDLILNPNYFYYKERPNEKTLLHNVSVQLYLSVNIFREGKQTM
jgi:hypothetical protein